MKFKLNNPHTMPMSQKLVIPILVVALITLLLTKVPPCTGVHFELRRTAAVIEKAGPKYCVSRENELREEWWNGYVEGIGAFGRHIKDSIILAQALDNADLYIVDLRNSSHGYSMADFFRPTPCPNTSNLECHVDHFRLKSLLPSLCVENLDPSTVLTLLGVDPSCETVVHVAQRSDASHLETYADFEECVAPFYAKSIRMLSIWPTLHAELQSRTPANCARIGIHIRWDDVAPKESGKLGPDTQGLNRRTISIPQINEAYSNIEFIDCSCQEIYIYIENNPGFVDGAFVFGTNFTVIDTHDDMHDLIHYMHNVILIHGLSGFTTFASFAIGSPKKIMVSDLKNTNQRFGIEQIFYSYKEKLVYTCGS